MSTLFRVYYELQYVYGTVQTFSDGAVPPFLELVQDNGGGMGT